MGPTPGRTSGNPSSPGDVPGFGGGGGSFAWTYNNLQPQLSASIAAGAGAAGLTAGAAALVSTLGLDIGLTASAAGPVGAVVGALTGLGFLFADLFGGGPDIPRELRLPAHSGLGMEKAAGQRDVVSQNDDSEEIYGGMSLAGDLRDAQEIIPFEPVAPFFDEMEPFEPFSFLPRQVTYSRCLDAAEQPSLWEDLCKDMPNKILYGACMGNLFKTVEDRRGFCRDLWAV